jgi:predicted nucleic acid-binding Zn ribbon protein
VTQRRGGPRRPGDGNEKPRKPQTIGKLLGDVLKQAGVSERVEQAQIIPEWPNLVGPQIAAVTNPQSITSDGTLFVWVTTNAWMTELSLLEPELLRSLNAKPGRAAVKKIRWLLRRP